MIFRFITWLKAIFPPVTATNVSVEEPLHEVNLEEFAFVTSTKGRNLIKKWEGLRLKAYKPHKDDVWTIGWGHTKTAVKGMVIDVGAAEHLLKQDLKVYEAGVLKAVKVPINQSQFDALVSFSYNVGVGAMSRSTLIRLLNAGDYEGAANQFKRWNKSSGRVFAGLTKRRAAEKQLFLA